MSEPNAEWTPDQLAAVKRTWELAAIAAQRRAEAEAKAKDAVAS